MKKSFKISAAIFASILTSVLFSACFFGDMGDDKPGKGETTTEKIYFEFDESTVICDQKWKSDYVKSGEAVEEGERITLKSKIVYNDNDQKYTVDYWTVNGIKVNSSEVYYEKLSTSDAVKKDGKWVIEVSVTTREYYTATIQFDNDKLLCKYKTYSYSASATEILPGATVKETGSIDVYLRDRTKVLDSIKLNNVTDSDSIITGYVVSYELKSDVFNGTDTINLTAASHDAMITTITFPADTLYLKITANNGLTEASKCNTSPVTIYEGDEFMIYNKSDDKSCYDALLNGKQYNQRGGRLKRTVNNKLGFLISNTGYLELDDSGLIITLP